MEKEKRRREALGEGRVDAEAVISELLEGVDLDKAVQEADDAESKTQRFQDIAYFKCSRLRLFSIKLITPCKFSVFQVLVFNYT